MSGSRDTRIFIIGAGFAGKAIAREIMSNRVAGVVAAFIDDDIDKIGTSVDDIPILGPIKSCAGLLSNPQNAEALIAIPRASTEKLKEIYDILRKAEFKRIRILPGISQIVSGDAHFIQTREIDPQDLLGRTPVSIDLKESLSYLRGKRVLITGAGGSIGSELSRQLLSGGAERLYLFGHGENSIYRIDKELRKLQAGGVGDKATIVPVIGELQDRDYMFFILKRLKADVIFHCAAYKHVPMMEYNPIEAVKNNVFGTKNVVDAAKEAGVERFVLISTDKAVAPSCVYGASKNMAENIVLNTESEKSQFMVVRFGNVLGSRGSIVPLFKEQILSGGPVTITHPETSRFFMTIPEAATLVLRTGGVGTGGNLYILDMGEPLKIIDMARQMIRFYGFREEDIEIDYIGMRPGEKIYETLWNDDDSPIQTEFSKIMKLPNRKEFSPGKLNDLLSELSWICFPGAENGELYRNRVELRRTINRYLPSVEVPANEPQY
ncbi:polysaccharide biosynthesis protein [Spirochaeta isovalerica]|uniref:FlaA1/EpsC-like NDP-sugar epimerase n=1 Tax=Spirochaeta isovalerica TaxID=150 RepID=A0A841RA31_9SPIO|nr:nucleoside-diphosphate sugar epimerase/dehydratase [Spirochaeta isovalerica]MBB6480606.1 FlaA1/EpsC-like NDP-sugar epimerase [Spirochaeta isovalerica]